MKIGGHEFKSFMEYVRIKHFLLDNPKVKFFGRWIAELVDFTSRLWLLLTTVDTG